MSQDIKPYHDIGARIRLAREALGYSASDFAKHAGFSRSQLSNWEGGLHRPSLDACIALRETYGLSIDFIVFGNMDALPHKIARALGSSPLVNNSK